MKKTLSILIPSLRCRQAYLYRLLSLLCIQVTGDTEVLFDAEPEKEQLCISERRNDLLKRSSGKWIVFIDDDDIVPEYYINEILSGLKDEPDCIGFWGLFHPPERRTLEWSIFSRENDGDCDRHNEIGAVHYRRIYHICPVKRDLAMETMFRDNKRVGEDKDYADRLAKFLKTEYFIKKVMYDYWPDCCLDIYRSFRSAFQEANSRLEGFRKSV